MKAQAVGALGALLMWGGWCSGAAAETFRCHQADGNIVFQESPCPIGQMEPPDAPRPAPLARPVTPTATPPVTQPVPAPAPAPVAKVPPASTPAATSPKPAVTVGKPAAPQAQAPGSAGPDEPVKPTRRKREVIELTAQFERCRADMPGFAERSEPIYASWKQRHGPVLAEFQKVVNAKVRAARRGETTLPLRICTEDWLAGIEPLSRNPDPRFQTVEKTWQVFMGALMTGDRATAMQCLEGRAEERWKDRVDRMSNDDLRRIAASIRELKVQWGDDYEKEGLVADIQNRSVGIAFRNVNEEWKITDWGGAPPSLPLPPQ